MGKNSLQKCCTLALCAALACSTASASQRANTRRSPSTKTDDLRLTELHDRKPRNVIFILTDDQRHDAMGFLRGQPFLETPNLDALARNGVHLANAFVTTALCSPSRASILTGQYALRHGVVDNDSPVPPGLIFFPQYLQRAGYETAFIGKWHMGGPIDDPQPGFNHWVSFKGQGGYLPDENGLNVDGKRVPQKGYITDELNSYALDWLKQRPRNRPFMLYLSHKAVHADFIRYKYIHYYGLWDINELYDIKADPREMRNLISSPEHQEVVRKLRRQMFELLDKTQGLSIPVKPAHWGQQNLRRKGGSEAAKFPPELIKRTTSNKRSSQRE